MAIAVDSTNVQQTNTSGASNKTLTWSTIGVDTDDIIVVVCVANVSAGTGTFAAPTTTSGSTSAWTQITLQNPNASCGVAAWWAKATATGNITVTQVTSRSGVNSVGVRGCLYEISGADTTTPIGSSDTHAAASDCLASNSNLEIQGESGNLVIVAGGNWNASGNNSEDIDSTSDSGYTAVYTGTTRYESGQADYHLGHTILSANDTTTRGVLDQVSGTGAWVAALFEIAVASSGVTVTGSQTAETDTANAGAAVVVKAGTQVAETDMANAGALRVALPGAMVAETDSAFGGAAVVVVAGSQVTETDTANAGSASSGDVSVNGSQATEADSAFAGAPVVVVAGSLASESDEARAGEAFMSLPGSGGGEEPGVTIVANRTTYRTTGPLAHQL